MIYIVDIDQTICVTPLVDGKHQYEQSTPIKHRIEAINRLYDQGNVIIYWTARGSSSGIDWAELTLKQLTEWGCKHSTLWLGKPSYDVWIDDKAFNDKEFFFLQDRDEEFDYHE